MIKKALIIGISGMDGTLLANLLISKGYEVYGTSRDFELNSFSGLKKMKIFDKVKLFSMVLNDFRSVLKIIDLVRPNEIYNLAGQTSVGYSFLQPVETIESIVNGCLNILESIKFLKLDCKIFNACSSECFGNTKEAATEESYFNPMSPYGVAKVSSFWLTSNYRKSYGIFTCSGILSNHESILRSERFVTAKIISSAYRIFKGEQDHIELGDISIVRDWGLADEYVESMYLMMQQDTPDDYIISTGLSISLEEFVDYTFNKFGLNYLDYLKVNNEFKRPNDISISKLNNQKALDNLNWAPKNNVYNVIDILVNQKIKDDQ